MAWRGPKHPHFRHLYLSYPGTPHPRAARGRGGAAPWKLCCGRSLAHWRLGLGNLLAEEGGASTPPALWASALPAETALKKVAQHRCCHLSPGEGPSCSVKSALGEPESLGRT